jgi:chorismate mutase/prephenate dehydratase
MRQAPDAMPAAGSGLIAGGVNDQAAASARVLPADVAGGGMSDELQRELAAVRRQIDASTGNCSNCSTSVRGWRSRSARSRRGTARRVSFIARNARRRCCSGSRKMNPGPLSNESVTWFFREVMSACLSLEQPLGIAFLGPLGTFSESAATKHFGHAARLMPQISIDDVFREVEALHADYAVVPIENSTEGAIGRTLDLLLTTPLKICGEVVLRIHQHLLSNETSLAERQEGVFARAVAGAVPRVAQPLAATAQRIPVGSNAQAAQLAAAETGGGGACR